MVGERALRVLVVLASNARRGAEIEGDRLAKELMQVGVHAKAVALAVGGADGARLDVPVLGPAPLSVRTFRALRREASAFDVVLAYGSTTLPACALGLAGARRPFVYRSIGDPAQWLRGRLHRWRTGFFMRRAAMVVPLWAEAGVSIQQLYGVPSTRVLVVPNARSADEFCPPAVGERSAARDHFEVADHETLAVVVGSLTDEKRVELAIRAVASLSGARLLVVGGGPCRSELERLGRELLGDRVTFTGALDDVRSVYHAADVLVLPSRTEGMPGVVVEAGLVGVPVAACDVGALRWLLAHGVRGALVPASAGPAEMAGAITVASGTPPSEHHLASTCSWDAVVTAWRTVLERVSPLPSVRPKQS